MRTINKRIISLILALIMLCGAMPISIFATMKTTASEENQWEVADVLVMTRFWWT